MLVMICLNPFQTLLHCRTLFQHGMLESIHRTQTSVKVAMHLYIVISPKAQPPTQSRIVETSGFFSFCFHIMMWIIPKT